MNHSGAFHTHQYRHPCNTTFSMNISMELFLQWNRFDMIYIPVIIVTGMIGNLFACYVLMATELRKYPPSVYLTALAASDTGYLAALTVFWLSMMGLDVYNVEGMCQFVTFVFNYFMVYSTWVVMMFTIERYFVIFYPLAKLARCSVVKARRNCIILAVFPALLEAVLFVNTGIITVNTTKGTRRLCGPLPNRSMAHLIHHLVDVTLGALIPFLVTTGVNLRVCRQLFHIAKAQEKLSERSSRPKFHRNVEELEVTYSSVMTGDGNKLNSTAKPAAAKHTPARYIWSKEARVTWSLLIIAVMFSILNFPYNFVTTKKEVTLLRRNLHYSSLEYSISRLSVDIFYLQFALDFFLYNLTSSAFRYYALDVLSNLIRRKWSSNASGYRNPG